MSISVLMSVYRSEKPEFLDRALKSIWTDQTIKPEEIVLVEDGPLGSDLKQVITKWKVILGDILVLIENEKNLGLTKSLNIAIEVSKGEYLARMDSDDISMPERFERQVKYLNENIEVDIVGGALQEFDAENENLGVRHYPLVHEDVLNYIFKASPLAHPTVMMRRSIFDNGLTYNETYRTSQDIALWFDAIIAGYRIGNLEDVTIKFRRDGDVFKRRSRAKAKNEFKIYMSGIRHVYGLFTLKYAYPLARFIFRMMPPSIVKLIYGSKMRRSVLKTSKS